MKFKTFRALVIGAAVICGVGGVVAAYSACDHDEPPPAGTSSGAPVAATTADSSSVEASSPSGTSSLPDRPQPRSS